MHKNTSRRLHQLCNTLSFQKQELKDPHVRWCFREVRQIPQVLHQVLGNYTYSNIWQDRQLVALDQPQTITKVLLHDLWNTQRLRLLPEDKVDDKCDKATLDGSYGHL